MAEPTVSSLLVDFNSYFASCEQQVRPELRGRPVGVVPMLADTTCLIAASYEAKKFGVKTLTNVAEAKAKIPDIELVVARHELYIDIHQRAVKAVDEIAPVRRVLSIDEMVCDLPAGYKSVERAIGLSQEIKRHLAQTIGEYMKVSIGIAPNLFLAKLASDMQKPDGLVVLEANDVPQKIAHLDLRALNGIGKNMQERLHSFGVRSIEDLYRQTSDQLVTIWGGVGGARFYRKLRGEEVAEPHNEMGSLSHSHVLPPELRDPTSAYAVLNRLTQKAAMRLRKACHTTASVSVKVKFLNAPTWDASSRVQATQDTLDLLHAVDAIWRGFPTRRKAVPLQVAVVFGDLVPDTAQNFSLFSEDPTKRRLNAAIDELSVRFGKRAVYFGGAHAALDHGRLAIAFNHIPDIETES
ncbi:MAG: DNA polymerase [Nitrosomonadaceae bacterium]|jgi:DNA polymerase-4|nr:DNA polymerase [Nitrosomonadaceae bacterium]